MNTSSGRLSVVGLAVVLGFFVGACGGGDAEAGGDPGESPSPTEVSAEPGSGDGESGSAPAEPSESESPAPVPASSEGPAQNWPEPEIPDAIYEESEDGALAALQYWFEAITYLQLTGDSDPVELTTGADCDVCVSRIDRYLDLYEREEGWYRADGTSATNEMSTVLEGGDAVAILFDIEDGEFEVFDSSGETIGITPAQSYQNAQATLRYRDDIWLIDELIVRESD